MTQSDQPLHLRICYSITLSPSLYIIPKKKIERRNSWSREREMEMIFFWEEGEMSYTVHVIRRVSGPID